MKKIAILGFGIVGRGTYEFIEENARRIKQSMGDTLKVGYALDLRTFEGTPYEKIVVHDIETILGDSSIFCVVETMGGLHPAYEYTKACLMAGKSVVSSNKQLVSTYGIELLKIAKEQGVFYLFEASTGGAIPLLHPLKADLSCNEVTGIQGILNGTTNYILTRMFSCGATFEAALHEAQELGYAEKDPTADVDGFDTARKICILTAIVTGTLANADSILREGIRGIRKEDVAYASKKGYSIRLLGYYANEEGGVRVLVAPFFVPQKHMLSSIEDVYNGAYITTNFAGETLLYGRGAGSHPTASAVAHDVIAIGAGKAERYEWSPCKKVLKAETFKTRHYIALKGLSKKAMKAYSMEPTKEGCAVITDELTEQEYLELVKQLTDMGGKLLSHIRLLPIK